MQTVANYRLTEVRYSSGSSSPPRQRSPISPSTWLHQSTPSLDDHAATHGLNMSAMPSSVPNESTLDVKIPLSIESGLSGLSDLRASPLIPSSPVGYHAPPSPFSGYGYDSLCQSGGFGSPTRSPSPTADSRAYSQTWQPSMGSLHNSIEFPDSNIEMDQAQSAFKSVLTGSLTLNGSQFSMTGEDTTYVPVYQDDVQMLGTPPTKKQKTADSLNQSIHSIQPPQKLPSAIPKQKGRLPQTPKEQLDHTFELTDVEALKPFLKITADGELVWVVIARLKEGQTAKEINQDLCKEMIRLVQMTQHCIVLYLLTSEPDPSQNEKEKPHDLKVLSTIVNEMGLEMGHTDLGIKGCCWYLNDLDDTAFFVVKHFNVKKPQQQGKRTPAKNCLFRVVFPRGAGYKLRELPTAHAKARAHFKHAMEQAQWDQVLPFVVFVPTKTDELDEKVKRLAAEELGNKFGATLLNFPFHRFTKERMAAKLNNFGFPPLANKGIANQGNSCFISVVMQLLYHSISFRDTLWMRKGAVCGREHLEPILTFIILQFQRLARSDTTWSPEMVNYFYPFDEQLPFIEHNAREFLSLVLRCIELVFTDADAPQNVFEGRVLFHRRCPSCDGTFGETFIEPFFSMDIQVSETFSESNVLRIVNGQFASARYQCPNEQCPFPNDAIEVKSCMMGPQNLLLHLRREQTQVSVDGKTAVTRRINTEFVFQDVIELKMPSGPMIQYRLYCVLNHDGESPDSGHWTAFCRPSNASNSQPFFLYDDANTPVAYDFDDVLRQSRRTCATLAYVRVDPQ